jgi:hypothetical protein
MILIYYYFSQATNNNNNNNNNTLRRNTTKPGIRDDTTDSSKPTDFETRLLEKSYEISAQDRYLEYMWYLYTYNAPLFETF